MVKKFKDIVKQNPEPARGKIGTSPMDPWNIKSGVAEASEEQLLKQYLKSRGINPEFVPVDTKIAHSKSGEFLKWRRDHEFREEIEILEATDKADTLTFDIPLMIRMLELAREDVKDDMELHRITERLIEIRSKGVLTMDDYEFIAGIKKLKEELDALAEGRMKDIATDAAETKRLNKMTTLQKFRADAAAREKKHDDISKNSGGMTSAIDRLEKHMNKEETSEFMKNVKKKVASAKADRYTHYSKNSDKDMPNTADTYAQMAKHQKKLAQEEVEQIDELKKSTVKSWLSQQKPIPEKKPGEERKAFNVRIKKRSKSWDSALDRLTDRKPTSEEVEPIEEASKKEWSKSARMIKSLYKKKGMKEETYDWEKDDKAQSYGKKPKIKEPTADSSMEKPEARIVMSGGKTLTGEPRDEVEVDPLMRKPSAGSQSVFDKPNKK